MALSVFLRICLTSKKKLDFSTFFFASKKKSKKKYFTKNRALRARFSLFFRPKKRPKLNFLRFRNSRPKRSPKKSPALRADFFLDFFFGPFGLKKNTDSGQVSHRLGAPDLRTSSITQSRLFRKLKSVFNKFWARLAFKSRQFEGVRLS